MTEHPVLTCACLQVVSSHQTPHWWVLLLLTLSVCCTCKSHVPVARAYAQQCRRHQTPISLALIHLPRVIPILAARLLLLLQVFDVELIDIN